MHSTMQRIIGALRARVESRFPRFRNRFKNGSCHSFSLFLSLASRLGLLPHCAILIGCVVSNGCLLLRRILVHLYLAVLSGRRARNPQRRCSFFSSTSWSRIGGSFLVNIAVSSKRFEYGKSIVFSPIGSNVGSYIRHGYKSNLTRMIRFMGFEYGMAERGGFVIRSWLVQRFEVRLWGNDDFVSTLDPCIFRF